MEFINYKKKKTYMFNALNNKKLNLVKTKSQVKKIRSNESFAMSYSRSRQKPMEKYFNSVNLLRRACP